MTRAPAIQFLARFARSSIGFLAIWGTASIAGCGGPARPPNDVPAPSAGALSPDVRLAKDRPPVAIVAREGDPAGAVAFALTTDEDDAEPAAALAGIIEARLAAWAPISVTPSWDGVRGAIVAPGDSAERVVEAIRVALTMPIEERDLAPAKRKLAALAQRPLADPALLRWARCTGSPYGLPERAAKIEALDMSTLERWRSSAHGLGHVALAVVGSRLLGEAVAAAVARAPMWKSSTRAPVTGAAPAEVAVYEASMPSATRATIYATLDVGTGSAAVTTAEALGEPKGAFAARLSELDLPFRVREVVGAAHTRGGCVGVVLEAAPDLKSASAVGSDLAARAADAVALLGVEANAHLTELHAGRDGRLLARRSGDAREAAERAAWWTLVETGRPTPPSPPSARRGSVALRLPPRRAAPSAASAPIEPSRETLAKAIDRADAAWRKPVVEGRTRVEAGQGEAWILVASPCGTDAESDADAGLAAIFATAAAEVAASGPETRVEPWIVPDGVGLLVHGPARIGETPTAHARRLADVVARSFAAEPLTPAALARARSALLRRDALSDGPALSSLAVALAPQHPSWVVALGSSDALARSSDTAILARAQGLRGGPIRLAVTANVDAVQADAAIAAADRWVGRQIESRSCAPTATPAPPRPGTYAVTPTPGTEPEAFLAFPLPAGDEPARAAATIIAAALDGDLLDKALGRAAASPLAREASAKLLGWPRAPALVIRLVAPQTQLDAAVMQTRGLVDRVRKGGLTKEDLDRANVAVARAALTTTLDPRARVVATWRGEPATAARPAPRPDDVRAFAQKYLAEDAMIIVAARPPRPPTPSPRTP